MSDKYAQFEDEDSKVVYVEDKEAVALRKIMNPLGDKFWLYNGIAVLMYGIFFFINPDGNNFYGPATSCYVVSD